MPKPFSSPPFGFSHLDELLVLQPAKEGMGETNEVATPVTWSLGIPPVSTSEIQILTTIKPRLKILKFLIAI